VPDWLTVPMTATLNGHAIEVTRDKLGWASLHRRWQQGDTLVVRLPFTFRAVDAPGQPTEPVKAIDYGPLVLAVAKAEGQTNPGAKFDFAHLAEHVVTLDGGHQVFGLKEESSVKLKPYLDYAEGEPYFMYLRGAARP